MFQIPEYGIIRLDGESGNIRNNRDRLKRGGGLLFYVSNKYLNYTTVI